MSFAVQLRIICDGYFLGPEHLKEMNHLQFKEHHFRWRNSVACICQLWNITVLVIFGSWAFAKKCLTNANDDSSIANDDLGICKPERGKYQARAQCWIWLICEKYRDSLLYFGETLPLRDIWFIYFSHGSYHSYLPRIGCCPTRLLSGKNALQYETLGLCLILPEYRKTNVTWGHVGRIAPRKAFLFIFKKSRKIYNGPTIT